METMRKTKFPAFDFVAARRGTGKFMAVRLMPLAVICFGFFGSIDAIGQSAPELKTERAISSIAAPMTLKFLLAEVAATHPSLLSARLESKAAYQDIETTSRQRWPSVSAVLEAGSSRSQSAPSRVLRIDQTLWDGGRVSSLIAQAESQASNSVLRVAAQRQQLFIQTIAAWQSLQSASARIRIAEKTMLVMNGYKAQMERRVEATASPGIDLLLVESRILQLEAELTTARTNRQVAITRLSQLSGVTSLRDSQTVVEPMQPVQFTDSFYAQVRDVDFRDAALTSPNVLLAKGEVEAAKARLQAKRAERWPNVYVRVDSPLSKPANTSGSNSPAAFVGIRYTPGAGFASFADAEAVATRTEGLEQAVETAARDALELMQNDRDELNNARLQISAMGRAIGGSQAVLESYSRQFQAGRKSWLDLLNAVRELVQNEFVMSDTNAAMLGAMHRLQVRTGQNLLYPG